MAYLVTARKWRPKKFAEVVGQEHITGTLKNAIRNNRIAHAYLFTGPRGVGKTTTARIVAKSLNCLNPVDSEPCGKCEICKDIDNGQFMDIIEIDGASNRGIDEIRTLRESVKYAPTRGKYKIYIIDEVHMLTKESFNAFLKTLEEPPDHTIFIFATTDVHKVPATIISRCQRFDFRRIQLDTIKETLAKIAKEEKIDIDDKTLTIIAKKADGALRDAESVFDQVVAYSNGKIDSETVAQMLNLIDDEIYFKISDAILNKDFKAVFDVTNTIYQNGWDFIDFLEGLVEHFRNIMTVVLTEKTALVETADVYRKRYLNYMDKFSEGDLLRIMNFLTRTQQELRFSQNQKLKIEIILTHLIGLERTSTISQIINELNSGSAIEKKNLINEQPSAFSSEASGGKKSFTPPAKTVTVPPAKTRKTVPASKVNEKTVSEAGTDFSFEAIKEKWQFFVDEISKERGLTLGPAINSIRITSLKGNKLYASSSLAEALKTIELNKKYLEDKSEKIFGKRLHINFSENPVEQNSFSEAEKRVEIKQKKKKSNDPLENYIIEQLGGVKIE